MRRVRPGSIQSSVQASISAAGGLECVSDDIGVSTANLSRATACDDDRPGGLGINHFDRLGRIIPASAVPLAQHFAHLAHGVFIPLATECVVGADMSELMLKFSSVLATHSEAMSERSKLPNDYTPNEARETIKQMDDMMAASAVVRAALSAKARGV
ncbi:MAG: hypothetical protein COA53_06525 [Rhodobacteraceae bacterium]|nr:MAG: hypothetical protein COA53_06525 [Paracoccaceae bacterium]